MRTWIKVAAATEKVEATEFTDLNVVHGRGEGNKNNSKYSGLYD